MLVDEGAQRMEIVIPDDQLSLAIGRRGQNVRLAAELTGWKLELSSESKMNERRAIAYESLGRIEGLGDLLLQTLYNYGYQSALAVAEGDVEVLAQIPGLERDRAIELVESARTAVASEHAEAGIRMELARDQAMRDRAIVEAVEGMSDNGRSLLGGLPGVSSDLVAACEKVGLSDAADWCLCRRCALGSRILRRFSLSDSRTWVVMHSIEKALVEAAEGDWDLLIDQPSADDVAIAESARKPASLYPLMTSEELVETAADESAPVEAASEDIAADEAESEEVVTEV